MSITQLLRLAIKNLMRCNIKDPAFEAEILLSKVINQNREYILAHPEIKISEKRKEKYWRLISRRIKGEPIAYLVKEKEFYGLSFFVDKNVLIPRPESEIIIETVKEEMKTENPIILDIGTGSGCLAICLALIFPKAEVWAMDIAEKALIVARKNAKTHQVQINFRKGNLLNPLPKKIWQSKGEIILLANLPYLKDDYQYKLNKPENIGLKFEPKQALYGGKDGLNYYRELFKQIKKIIPKKTLKMILEINPEQVSEIKEMAKNSFPKFEIKVKKDLKGNERVILIKID